ncbi:hypothetical protein FHX44_111945 [Pseudonocardia hierapolitana]|uniref:Uncharacterized protein n=2 Tax=Pseudonocardia hierapolitana TaxID=1128676 RepID=A0A561SMH1_9PSEU|nr:hypothetical protein FHX44_111945 [Pseudonocardia hierapolitana]
MVQRKALRLEGYGDDEVRRLLRAGRLTPVRRGAYVLGTTPDSREARHALAVRAELAHLADGAVVSHASAAVLHGLPTWGIRLDRVHVTRARRSGGRCGRHVHVHTAPLRPEDVGAVDGIPVTSVARTVTDLARTIAFEPAVAVADAALHAVLTEPERLAALQAALVAALAHCAGWRGSPDARRVLAFADARSGSVGDSRSRAGMGCTLRLRPDRRPAVDLPASLTRRTDLPALAHTAGRVCQVRSVCAGSRRRARATGLCARTQF